MASLLSCSSCSGLQDLFVGVEGGGGEYVLLSFQIWAWAVETTPSPSSAQERASLEWVLLGYTPEAFRKKGLRLACQHCGLSWACRYISGGMEHLGAGQERMRSVGVCVFLGMESKALYILEKCSSI